MQAIGGLDLARRSDFSALIRLEHDGHRAVVTHSLRLPQVAYADQIGGLAPALGGLSRLAVDAGGVGDPVVEMIKAAQPTLAVVPVVITGGVSARLADDGRWSVPKGVLVDLIRTGMGNGSLAVAPSAPGREDLRAELAAFWATQAGRGVKMEAAVGHDDLVMALGLAIWASRIRPTLANVV